MTTELSKSDIMRRYTVAKHTLWMLHDTTLGDDEQAVYWMIDKVSELVASLEQQLEIDITPPGDALPGGLPRLPFQILESAPPQFNGVAKQAKDTRWQINQVGAVATKPNNANTIRLIAMERTRYPKRPAFGAPTEHGPLVMYDNDGTAYDLINFKPLDKKVPSQNFMPSWVNSDQCFVVSGTGLYEWRTNGAQSLVADFGNLGARGQLGFGDFEGRQSVDDDVFVITDKPITMMISYSRTNGVLGTYTANDIADDVTDMLGKDALKDAKGVNWVSTTARGQYISGVISGVCHFRYSLDFREFDIVGSYDKNGKLIPLEPMHGDNLISATGIDSHAQVHWGGGVWWNWDNIHRMMRIPERAMIGHGHISGTAVHRPGYIVHSSRDVGTGQKMFGIKLDEMDYLAKQPDMNEKHPERLGFPIYPTDHLYTEYWGDALLGKLGYIDTGLAQPDPTGRLLAFNTARSGKFALCLMSHQNL